MRLANNVDDCIRFTEKCSKVADMFIKSLYNGPEKFILED